MTWAHALIAGCFTLSLGFAACGDEDTDPPADTSVADTNTTDTNTGDTTPADTNVADTAEEDTAVADTATDDTAVADTSTGDDADTVTPAGACTNAADQLLIDMTGAPRGENEDPAAVAQSCGISCLSAGADPAVRTCTIDCVINGKTTPAITGIPLTEGCAGCYADVVICAKNNCLAQCLDGGDDCAQCRETAGCNAAFFTCSGLTP